MITKDLKDRIVINYHKVDRLAESVGMHSTDEIRRIMVTMRQDFNTLIDIYEEVILRLK